MTSTPDELREKADQFAVGLVPVASDVMRRAATHIERQAAELAEAREVLDALDWLDRNPELSLQHEYEDEGDNLGTWRVHRVAGNVNDREWNLVGEGETPAEALISARSAITQMASTETENVHIPNAGKGGLTQKEVHTPGDAGFQAASGSPVDASQGRR